MGCNKYDNRDDRLTEISSVFSKTESVRASGSSPSISHRPQHDIGVNIMHASFEINDGIATKVKGQVMLAHLLNDTDVSAHAI